MSDAALATLGERAWMAQQRRLEVRIADVRLELLDDARSRHDAVLQAAGNIVRKALLACRQVFDRLSGLITAQDKIVARLETEASEQRTAIDQRLVDVQAELRTELCVSDAWRYPQKNSPRNRTGLNTCRNCETRIFFPLMRPHA